MIVVIGGGGGNSGGGGGGAGGYRTSWRSWWSFTIRDQQSGLYCTIDNSGGGGAGGATPQDVESSIGVLAFVGGFVGTPSIFQQ